MFIIIFLILFVLSFVGIIGWQDREDFAGRSSNKQLAVGIFAAVFFLFLIIALPRFQY